MSYLYIQLWLLLDAYAKKGMLLVTSDNDVATKIHLENLMLTTAG